MTRPDSLPDGVATTPNLYGRLGQRRTAEAEIERRLETLTNLVSTVANMLVDAELEVRSFLDRAHADAERERRRHTLHLAVVDAAMSGNRRALADALAAVRAEDAVR